MNAKGNLFKPLCQVVNKRLLKGMLLKALPWCCMACAAWVQAAFEGLNENSAFWFPPPVAMFSPTHDRTVTLERSWRFGLPELSIDRFGVLVFHDNMIGKAGWTYSGDKLYSESILHFGYGIKSKKLAGIAYLKSYHMNIEDYGSASTMNGSLELHYRLIRGLVISAGSDGLTVWGNPKLQEAIESRYWASIDLYNTEMFYIRVSGEVTGNHQAAYSLSLRTSITEAVWGGFAVGENPNKAGVLLAIQVHSMIIDIASSFAPPLGWCNGLRISYQW